ncbi:MAG: FtsW/RodA/SpoVE family cell cycle protein [Clostridiales bacterium]|nr:FtsW/RodA/SpoVE family cell cycle protein [Clostridiales bacterium]
MARRGKKEKTIKYFDYSLLFLVIFLLGFGLVMLYSVSSYEAQSTFGDATYYLRHQVRNICVGLVFMVGFTLFPYKKWEHKVIGWIAWWAAFLLCLAVLFVGSDANGSTRWLEIGHTGMVIQPSEFAKIFMIVYMAIVLARMPKNIKDFRSVVQLLIRIAPVIIVVAVQDLSTAIIIAGICVLMMFVASPKYSHFIALLVFVGIVIVAFAIYSTNGGYRGERVQAWLHPEDYPDKVYQTMQGLYAIGSGGLFGKGLGGSIQKLGYVPEAQNDFIFTIICEELGLFGGICVILLFVLLIWRLMVIANNSSDMAGGLMVVGIMAHVSLQVILNLAVVTNSIPNTGVILPFFSYGGSSMIVLLMEMGLALSVSRGIHLGTDLAIE